MQQIQFAESKAQVQLSHLTQGLSRTTPYG